MEEKKTEVEKLNEELHVSFLTTYYITLFKILIKYIRIEVEWKELESVIGEIWIRKKKVEGRNWTFI